mmetsp:Transcript_44149/g.107305  ORF Transcript_44149/g.107305 Transcript_44149/m.107305 type:complete len:157 (+) Transcript_44149:187-657(+)
MYDPEAYCTDSHGLFWLRLLLQKLHRAFPRPYTPSMQRLAPKVCPAQLLESRVSDMVALMAGSTAYVAADVGACVGAAVGALVGADVGVGFGEGESVGALEGAGVTGEVGPCVGAMVGALVGADVGLGDGEDDTNPIEISSSTASIRPLPGSSNAT